MTNINRYINHFRQNCIILGPRGTGKTTWLKSAFPESAYIDLLDPVRYREYLARPERLLDFTELNKEKNVIIIDEIQRVPQLLPVVHKLIETEKSIRFILTGSSARKLKRTGADLLGGRAIVKQMHPFMASELGIRFNLEKCLNTGLVPLVVTSEEPKQTLNGYINLYLQQEIISEGLIRNIDGFARFLEVSSFSHACELNISGIARECGVKRSTVSDYIEILEDMLIAKKLPVFTRRAKRATTIHPKFYLFDSGVFGALRPKGPIDLPQEMQGPAMEGLIFQHLRAWIDYSDHSAQLYFWRTKAGNEVDFILYGDAGFYAIEVKNSSSVHNKDLRGLTTFSSDYPECVPFLLYRGTERIMLKNIPCLPVQDFLLNLVPGKPLPL